MSLPAVRLTLLIGPTIPVPAPLAVVEALSSVEVTHKDEGRSAFQLVLRVGRGPSAAPDYALLNTPLLGPSRRVVVIVTTGGSPNVIMDGIITNQQLLPGDRPGTSTLKITGEDVSVAMDREEKSTSHPGQSESVIAMKIILDYEQYGLVPMVIPPLAIDVPLPMEHTPVQQGTDLTYLRQMASRFAYVFYVDPGPLPLMNTAYWGPPIRTGAPQRAITVNMGSETNATISTQFDPLAATSVQGKVQDRTTNISLPVQALTSQRPPLARESGIESFGRTSIFRGSAGLNGSQASNQAQAETDKSSDVVTVEGELDMGRYGAILRARGLVGVRGAGTSYDGLYYVKQVKHLISRTGYKQSFTLTREGLGSTVPVVMP